MPDLRQDPISGRLVVIAEERAKRPLEFQESPVRRSASRCPFCAGNEQDTPEAIANYAEETSDRSRKWQVRVVPNKYPAINGSASAVPTESDPAEKEYRSMAAQGAHEVIIESPDHLTSITELTDEQTRLVYVAYRDRLKKLSRQPGLAYGLIFKNSGARAGASLEHLHSQLVAIPLIPPEIRMTLDNCQQALRHRGQCVFCWMVEYELNAAQRIVAESPSFVALCPFASRFDYETWIVPRKHTAQFDDCSDQELDELSRLVRDVASRVENTLGGPCYNLLLHTGPFDRSAQAHYHWHIEAFPRLTQLAGFELATNCYINSTPPEKAAALLRRTMLTR